MDICGKCMGTGIAGHPDSGMTCDCNGGMTDTRDEVERLVERLWASDDASALTNQAARQRAEAADSLIAELRQRYAAGQVALTEARAQIAAAWEAGRDAAADMAAQGHHPRAIRALTPPADASAALTDRLDAEWNAAIDKAAQICDDLSVGYAKSKAAVNALADAARDIRTLRRDPTPPFP